MIICLFGPDGSGKTTIARELERSLNDRFRVKVSWVRGTHTLASLVARFLSNFSVFRGSGNIYYRISIPRGGRKVWQFLEFISFLPVLFVRFYVPSLLGYLVIAERYVPDFVVWVVVTTDDSSYLSSIVARFLLALTLRTRIRIYVRADLQKLLERRSDMDPYFIKKEFVIYERLAKSMGSFVLDTTSKSVDESLRVILAFVDQNLNV
ncbi:MAG: hypothetical protein ACPLSP_03505 [Fervidicoccus fontis]